MKTKTKRGRGRPRKAKSRAALPDRISRWLQAGPNRNPTGLAAAIGVSERTVHAWHRGEREPINGAVRARVDAALDDAEEFPGGNVTAE